MTVKNNVVALLVMVLVFVGCKDKQGYSKVKKEVTTTISSSDSHKIVVKELIPAGTYAYLNVEENNKTYWMAVPNTKIVVGDTYYYDGGMMMKSFESKQLKRTFDEIIFAEGIRTSPTSEKVVKPKAHSHKETKQVEVAKLSKENGQLYLNQILSNTKKYANKKVEFTGVVIKVNKQIMKKNWIHIVDGSEFGGVKSLTVTTDQLAKVGDTVTVVGKLILDKDFGYGYVYDVLLENAKIKKN
ncbi:hypothetical protein SAMN05444411_104199 [Lutibacter oricola]|uniref:Uncharacterized protein n=1 Tax=Lutibacter oricola TaxID=762486 RepID=A0A1H3AQA9_9FLAO|nr:hypothetical protein [Lutibacter oricola]SDX31930.1 hypothetical protein SAMN05444411_104199 [Lutibacter oricola]